MQHINPKAIQQILVLILILIMGGLIFGEILPYLSGVLGAITIYVLMHKWMLVLVRKGWRPSLAASFLMFLSFIGILLPVAGIILMLSNKIGNAVNNSEKVVDAIKEQLTTWQDRLGYDLSSQIDVSAISSWISENLQSFAGSTFHIFIAIGIMYFMLYYMLTSSKTLTQSLTDVVPFSKKNRGVISKEITVMVRSNALGIPLVAIAQGIIALIGFLIFGIADPIFWFVIVSIGSMIPFVGTLIGILPVFILSLATGDNFQAWGILLYGFIVVGSTDNIIRLYVLQKLDDVHPLITLIGVIVGVPLFGFIGLIFGPLLISLFLVVLRIYINEYGESSEIVSEK
jgi:predicted PurR-regulated permease PerM